MNEIHFFQEFLYFCWPLFTHSGNYFCFCFLLSIHIFIKYFYFCSFYYHFLGIISVSAFFRLHLFVKYFYFCSLYYHFLGIISVSAVLLSTFIHKVLLQYFCSLYYHFLGIISVSACQRSQEKTNS